MKRGDFLTIAMQGDFCEPRPALVIQSDQFNEHATITVLPVSSTLVDAPLLPAKRFDLLGIAHIAEEIEDAGKSEQRELANRMAVLLAHLLKWQHQPERRGSSWARTIKAQRERIASRIERTPSLQACLNDPGWWLGAWDDAPRDAAKDTGLEMEIFDSDWLPGSLQALGSRV